MYISGCSTRRKNALAVYLAHTRRIATVAREIAVKTLLARLLTARSKHDVIEFNTVITRDIQATLIAGPTHESAHIVQGVIGDPLENTRATTLQR